MTGRIFEKAVLILLAVVIIFPVLYALSASFFSPVDFTDSHAHLLPSSPDLSNYSMALSNRYYPRFIANSLITSLLLAALRTVISVLAAFAFTHLRFRGSRTVMIILLTTMFIPPDALLYPNYSTIASLGLLDTYAAIILPSVFSASSLLLLTGAFSSSDRDVYMASKIDGAGDFQYIVRILVPMAGSFVIAVFLQTFITGFSSYLWPLLVTSRMSMRTVQVGISMLGFAEAGEYGAQFAAIIMITLPFLILLGVLRKRIVDILSSGGMET